MTVVTAKELKNRTGQVLQRVRQGEDVVVTVRGEPVARFVPIKKKDTKTREQEMQEKVEFIHELAGKYQGIISVDEFLLWKEEELTLEDQ
ncbi:MAG: type II toxin-antitoxin system prevent-host-death family antitoxin [Candidatus Bipolaricaulota bacterium]|nr:type II toxin-antitoxin system prevent-host-death family antitoxin [Candidatus Bipolaricaulota bacterium]